MVAITDVKNLYADVMKKGGKLLFLIFDLFKI